MTDTTSAPVPLAAEVSADETASVSLAARVSALEALVAGLGTQVSANAAAAAPYNDEKIKTAINSVYGRIFGGTIV